MAGSDLSAQWRATIDRLESARRALTDPDDERLATYREFLHHNELGLAFDALADIADSQRAPQDVWESLLVAAGSMKLDGGDAVHGLTVGLVMRHLTAKKEWFELRALLNEWDPIGVYDPITNFPSDEYDCMEAPLMSRLQRGDTRDEISEYLSTELREHFGLDPQPSRPHEFAQRLVVWFASVAN